MQRVILVCSPDSEFIQQIRSHLEEGGRFRVSGVANGHDALTFANHNFFDVAILDAEINDIPFVPFTRDLVAIQPNLKILVFPLQNNPHHPVLTGLVANGFLNKPFFGPEVGSALAGLFQEISPEPKIVVERIDDLANLWLKHPEMGAKRVEQLIGATTATTGLLVMRGQVIAGSGSTDDSTISNVVGFLSRYWKDEDNSELVRFMKMEGDTNEHLIYATKLISNVVLVLFYTPATSIQQVRSEVSQVKKEFLQAYPTTGALRREIAGQSIFEPEPEYGDQQQARISVPFLDEKIFPESEALEPFEAAIETDDIANVLSEKELLNLDSLLANMPPPDPELSDEDVSVPPLPISELNSPAWIGGLEETQEIVPSVVEMDNGIEPKPEESPEIVHPVLDSEKEVETLKVETSIEPFVIEEEPVSEEVSKIQELPNFDFILPWEIESSSSQENSIASDLPSITAEVDQINSISTPVPSNIQHDTPVDTSVSSRQEPGTKPLGLKSFRFNYTCILIPENPKQYLARDLSERLGFILPQLHLAEGWRLTGISIRPLYLLWTVSVSLEICPFQIIREIRRRTTTHIFLNFPEIAEKNKTNDFWSSDFLVLSGFEPPSVNLIYDFISQTRKNHKLVAN